MISIMETNSAYTKINTMKEADFHSNAGKSGSSCNYGSSYWKGADHPSAGYVYPKVTLYDYERITDGEIDPTDTGTNYININTANSVVNGMFCEKPQLFETFAKEYSNSRIYPLGSDIDGYYLNNFYSTVGLQSKSGKIIHKTYLGKHLSKDCPNFHDGVRPWKLPSSDLNYKVVKTSDIGFNHCDYKEKNPYLFIDRSLIALDVKRNSDGTMNKTYYNGIDTASVVTSFSPKTTSGYVCFSILVRGNLGEVQASPHIEGSGLTIDSKSIYISNSTASEDSISIPYRWERLHYIVHYTSNTSLTGSIALGLKIPVYSGDSNNLSLGISLCGGIISETPYPLAWNPRLREANIPTSRSQLNFDLIPDGDTYKDDVTYLSTRPWTMVYKRKIEAGNSTITDTIGRLKITTTLTPTGGKIQLSSLVNGAHGNNNNYTLDYSKSPVETIYVVFNGTDTLKYFLYERNTLIKSFTQKITDFSNCLDSIFIEETDTDGNVITKNKNNEDVEPIRVSAILGGTFSTISSASKVRDTDLDVVLCDVAYSDFIFIDNEIIPESEITRIQNGFMTIHNSDGDSSARKIIYEYTIFEETEVQNADSSVVKSIKYAGVLEDTSPTNTFVMYADKFTEK